MNRLRRPLTISVCVAMRWAKASENARASCRKRASEIVATDRACCCASHNVVKSPAMATAKPSNQCRWRSGLPVNTIKI